MEEPISPEPARALAVRAAIDPGLDQMTDRGDPLTSMAARLGCVAAPARVLLHQAGWPVDPAEENRLQSATWSSPAGTILVVVAMDGCDVVRSIGRAARLREAALAAFGATPREHVTCLFVAHGSCDLRAVDRAAVVRRVADAVRVVTSEALSRLASLVAEGMLGHVEAVSVLRPAGACADDVVSIVDGSRRPTGTRPASGGTSLSCPQCSASGVRTALRPADLGGNLVYLHCRDCGHVWSMEERRASA